MTTTIETMKDDIALVRLDEPRGNSLSFDTIAALERNLAEVERSGARVVVITGRGGDKPVFSAGLDLRACARFDRAELARYVDAFEGLFERVFSFPLPLVAWIEGPAVAGGAVLAYAADVRIVHENASIALNEVGLGLVFPSMAFEIARFAVPHAAHVDVIALGKPVDADDAVRRGLATARGESVDDALSRARHWLKPAPLAASATKRMLRAEALARARANAADSRRAFVDSFLGEAQARIQALVAKLENR